MKYEFRKLSPENLEEILFLERTCFPHPWNKKQLQLALQNPSIFMFGVFKNSLVAYVSCFLLIEEAEILNLAVLPSFRKQGLGSFLLENLLLFCKEQKVEKVFLEVRESNIIAQKLYFKFGFKQVGLRKNYYPDNKEHALLMVLNLKE